MVNGRRPVPAETWATLHGHVQRQWDKLPKDSPRIRPSLPRLRFMRDHDAEARP
jgi:hypothetical protein